METPLRPVDVVRMVAAQLCFIASLGLAVVALLLISSRVDDAILTVVGLAMGAASIAAGIGVAILSRRASTGLVAGFALAAALFPILCFAHLVWSFFDLPIGGGL